MPEDVPWTPESREPSSRDWLPLTLGGVALAVVAFWVAAQFVDPAPPDRFVISAGSEGGPYTGFARRYAREIARHGIEVEVLTSAGSAQNVARLRGREADVALVQGGTSERRIEDLWSLGAVFLEPVWLFHRADRGPETLAELRGARLAIGPEGSGTRALALRLLAESGIAPGDATLAALPGAEAAEALRARRLDAALFVASAESSLVRGLLLEPSLRLMDFVRAPAYARTHRFLSTVVLPRGVIDMQRDVPEADKQLIAPAANLVVHPHFHPALSDLVLQAAVAVHGEPALFAEPDEFPAPRYLVAPLSAEARRFYKEGPPFLQRYLPFWAATLVDRLKVMLVPLVALLIPLFRIFPPVYRWRVRSRIYRWYKALRNVDPEGGPNRPVSSLAERTAELDRIETEVRQVPTPASYAEELYDLRLHLELVRRRLERARAESEAGGSGHASSKQSSQPPTTSRSSSTASS